MDVTLQRPDGQSEHLQVQWLIGCDGPHSAVRHLLGLDFAGWTLEQSFVLADMIPVIWNS